MDCDGVELSCWLLVDLSILALLAVAAHSCHVFAHSLLDKMGRHHMLGGMYARVGHAGDGMEKLQICPVVAPEALCRLAPSTLTVLTVREEDLVACCVLGQLAWLAAILEKEMPAAGCTSAMPAVTPGSEGGEEFSLPPCRAFLHRSPPREAHLPPRVLAAWRGPLRPHWLPWRCGGLPM